MLNTEVLADLKKHKEDLDKYCEIKDQRTRNAMLDRLLRDLMPDKDSEFPSTQHGIKHVGFYSMKYLAQRLQEIQAEP